jgi:hypothetical protein
MSSVPIKDADNATRKVDTFTRTDGADVVETQAVALVDPASGLPISVATAEAVQALLTDAQLRATPIPVADTPLADLQASIQALNETMLFMLSAMLEKMPRLDSADRLIARVVVGGENELNSAYGGVYVNGVGNSVTGQQVLRMFEPWNFSDAGCVRIYQQIQVSP